MTGRATAEREPHAAAKIERKWRAKDCAPLPVASQLVGKQDIDIFRKVYYSMPEVVAMTGCTPSIIRYWRSRYRRLCESKPRDRSARARFTAKHIVMILLISAMIDEFGATVAGAIEVVDALDIDEFIEHKLLTKQQRFTRYDLRVLLQLHIARRAEILFGSSEYAELKMRDDGGWGRAKPVQRLIYGSYRPRSGRGLAKKAGVEG